MWGKRKELAHGLSSYFTLHSPPKNALEPCTRNSPIAVPPFEPLRYDIIVHEAILSSLSDRLPKDMQPFTQVDLLFQGKNVPITIKHFCVWPSQKRCTTGMDRCKWLCSMEKPILHIYPWPEESFKVNSTSEQAVTTPQEVLSAISKLRKYTVKTYNVRER